MPQFARLTFALAGVLSVLSLPVLASPHAPDLARIPMTFEQNKGQAPSDAEFLSRGPGYTVLFGRKKVRIYTGQASVTMRLVDASIMVRIEGTEEQQNKTNYFIGNDPGKWHAGVPNYLRVRYHDVYPGIDLVFYGNGTQLEYDWIVGVGADPSRIRTKFEGVRGMRVSPSGDLLLAVSKGQLEWHRPVSYQREGERKVAVQAEFKITRQREVRFALGSYDRGRPLVIDPILLYATYIGGTGTDYLFALAVDAQGNSYITGGTQSSNFPICPGDSHCANTAPAYQTAFKAAPNGYAGFITKINAAGTALLYSTFVGGTGGNNSGTAIAVDSLGYAYVTGGTSSTDFPILHAFQGQNNGGSDVFLLKLSPDGGSLLYSTYLGGTADETSQGIALDSATNVYLTGWTKSTTTFPTKNPIRLFGGGVMDAFLTKINSSGSAPVYSTYIGGNGDDNSFAVGVDSLNQAFITGQTNSTAGFPLKNAFQPQFNGGIDDVFVTAVNAAGSDFLYSTYLGGDDKDTSRALYVDPQTSNVYVTGDSQSPVHLGGVPFPTTSNAYSRLRGGCGQGSCVGGSADAFLTKLSATGAMVYSTYFGGSIGYDGPGGFCPGNVATYGCGADKGLGITVDPAGNILIGGTTNSTDFPTASPTQPHNAGGYDAFVIKFNGDFNAAQKILFSTYFGGSGTDYAYNLARTPQGAIYVSGWASNSVNFPRSSSTTPLFPTYGGGLYDGFVMELANADVSVVKHGFHARSQTASSSQLAAAGGIFGLSAALQNSASSTDADNGYMTITATGKTTLDSCQSDMGTCAVSGNMATVSGIATLTRGAIVNVNVNGHINPDAVAGDQITFQMYGLSDTNDPNPANNGATDGFTIPPQGNCDFTINSTATSFTAAGGSGSFTATSPCGFGWVLSNPVNWIVAPSSGASGAPTSFTVLSNPTTSPRSANLNISGLSWGISQAGMPAAAPATFVLYEKSTGTEYTASSNNNGTYSYTYNLFTPAFDTLRSGDFNGDGKSDLVVYNSQNALAYIGFGTGSGTFAFQSLFWSPGYNFVETGDLNGDGKTDFALYNSATGTMYTAISNGVGGFTYKYTLISIGFTFLRLADFTGDGKADIFVYSATNGQAFLGVGDGSGGFAFHPLGISPGYNLADVGDLNGDGKADIILYNSSSGNAASGISDGLGGFAFTPMLFSPGFTSVRLADYTGDGKADLTVYNVNNATAYFGTGTGTGGFNFQSLFWSPGYDTVIARDVNGDAKADVVLYNSATGTEYTGISNGTGGFTYTYSLWGAGKTVVR